MQIIKVVLTLLVVAVLAIAGWNFSEPPAEQDKPGRAVDYFNKTFARTDSPLKEYYFEHHGNRLHVIEGGVNQKGAVLFLHGFPSFWYSLARQMSAVQDQYRVIAIDGLGAGKSSAPGDVSQYRLQTMTQHILALMDSLEEPEFHLVGHDWGSALALGMAQQHPNRVLSVTGISAPPQNVLLDLLQNDPLQREKFSYVGRLIDANPILLALFRASDKIFQSAYRPLQEAGFLTADEVGFFRAATADPRRINRHINWYRANIPNIDHIQDSDYWPSRATNLMMPTLLILGEDDPSFSKSYLEKVSTLGNQVEFVTYEGVGHWPHIERANQVNRVILGFLDQPAQVPGHAAQQE